MSKLAHSNDETMTRIDKDDALRNAHPDTVAAAFEELEAQRDDLLMACRYMIAWDESETTGPDYGSQDRDTHPRGEVIWKRWWDDQYALCRLAFDHARAAITRATEKGK